MKLRPDLALLPLHDEWVAFSQEAQCLVGLNASAAFVVRELQQGAPPSELARDLASRGRMAPEEAERWLVTTLEGLGSSGLLADGPLPPARPTGSLEEDERHAALQNANMPPYAPFKPATEQRYRLLNTCALIRFAFFAQKRLVDAVVGHLATDDDCAPTVVIDIPGVKVGRGISSDVYRDGTPYAHAPQLSHLGPEVKAALWQSAINAHEFRFYIHAGVVGTGESCILLPAAPGSGKSSMTAALTHRGFRYYSDEVALIEPATFHVPPVPLATCVKSTGWDVMARYYPDLSALPLHRRGDGKVVRYVAPPASAAGWPRVPVSHIIFPRYEKDAATELEPVPRSEALGRLMSECLAVRQPLDRKNVDELIGWIAGIDCYALTFSSLEDAAALVAQAVGRQPS